MTFKRRLKPAASVDLIPMIDVVFQLVIFFMVSSTFLLTPGITIELPDSSTAEPVVMTRLVVSIVSEEEIYLNREAFTLESLPEGIETLREREEIEAVIIEGDSGVSYSLMVRLLDILRENGFSGITLRTTEE
jgi:biopolymer transport protein ExbD